MEKSLTYLELAEMVLREAKKPLHTKDIWRIALEKGYYKHLISVACAPEQALSSRILKDIRNKGENSIFLNTGEQRVYSIKEFALQKESLNEKLFEFVRNEKKHDLSIVEIAQKVLQEAETPLRARRIWEIAEENGLVDFFKNKSKKPTTASFASMIVYTLKKEPKLFMQIGDFPARFWLKTREKELPQDKIKLEQQIQKEEDLQNLAEEKALKFIERDLHPLLVYFLKNNENFNLEAKTIFHENCIKGVKGKRLWNYPDIVGVRFPNLADETTNLLSNINQGSYRFYSFELKISINFSNLKECYFQAVSNSSWVNEGYLVAFKDIEEDVLKELKRLNQSFGIGVIQLEKSPLESEVILPARSRNLDIETLNMLVKDSPDFQNFVKEISGHIAAKNQKLGNLPIKSDKVLSDEQLEKHIANKKIEKI